MCGRYFLGKRVFSDGLLQAERSTLSVFTKNNYEVFPTDSVPVIARSRVGEKRVFAMKWGYTTSNGKVIINARSETAAHKPMFVDGIKQRRCLIPATCYFEWRKSDKVKHAIKNKNTETMFMAGIYRFEEQRPVFVILTKEASKSICFIHDRMPVILSKEEAECWLDAECDGSSILRNATPEVDYTEVETAPPQETCTDQCRCLQTNG